MPSPSTLSQIQTGPGKLHVDVSSAASDLANSGSSAVLETFGAALNQPIIAPASKVGTAGAGGALTIFLSSSDGPVYVGSGGDDIQDLFKVVRASDDSEIFNQELTLYASPSSVLPAIGNGFVNSATVTLAAKIPEGVQYRIYYGKRATVGNIPLELASFPVRRRSANRTRFPEFPRDGMAPTSVAAPYDIVASAYLDPYMSQWRGTIRGTVSINTTPEKSGATGFVYIGRKRNAGGINDRNLDGTQAAAFMSAYEKDIDASTLSGNAVWTRINAAANATLNPGGGLPTTVELNASDFFLLTAPERTAIRLGVDLLEVTYTSGVKIGVKEVFIINNLSFASNVRRATLKTLGNADPNFSTETVKVKWIRMGFFQGGDLDATFATNLRGMGHFVPGSITADPTGEVEQGAPFFSAGTILPSRADVSRDNWNLRAFTWGGFTETSATPSVVGAKRILGELWGDGSIQSFGGRVSGLINARPGSAVSVTATSSYQWSGHTNSFIHFTFTNSTAKILTITTSNYTPQDGDRLTVLVTHAAASTGAGRTSTIVWPGTFLFSGTDGDVSTLVAAPTVVTFKFECVYSAGNFYVTRTDY